MSFTVFPIYRKYCNAQTYFKVESNKVLIERQILGGKYFENKIIAGQYPEMLKIQDIIKMSDDIYCESSAAEFDSISQTHTAITV